MRFEDLDIKGKALNTINDYVAIIKVNDLTDEEVAAIEEAYYRAMDTLEMVKERLCMLAALRSYAFQLEEKSELTGVEEDIMNSVNHFDDAMNDLILTNF